MQSYIICESLQASVPFVQKQAVVTYAQEMQFSSVKYMLEFRDTTSRTVLVGSVRNKIF